MGRRYGLMIGLAAAVLGGGTGIGMADVFVTLGEQDFVNGAILTLDAFNSASVGEPAPFNGFMGSDPGGTVLDATWTFNYAAGPVTGGALVFGIYDHDSQASGSQVASFLVDGVDLTAMLDALFESSGGAQTEYNVYTIALPASTFAALSDGTATISLTLSPPSLGGGGELPGNGAGLDFSTLRLSQIPAPGAAVLGLIGLGSITRLRRRMA